MRREGRHVALGLAVLFSVSGLFAASPPAKPEKKDAMVTDPISAAVCGRGKGRHANLAKALDDLNPSDLPPIWRAEGVDQLERWLEAPACSDTSGKDVDLYRSRRRGLEQLGRRLERAKVTERIGIALAPLRDWNASPEEWPSDSECGDCAALRYSAARIANVAARWPTQQSSQLGALLDVSTQREDLIAEFCAAQPSPNARAEIERKFLYYSWTASAARLFKIAALFEKPEIAAECRGR